MTRFAVVLTSPDHPKTTDAASVIAKLRKIPLQDAVHEIKPRWGLIEENADEASAMQLVQLLKDAGLGARMIPQSTVAPHQKPSTATALRLTLQGPEVSPKKDEWHLMPWDSIALLGAAIIKEKSMKTLTERVGPSMQEKLIKTGIMLATGLPLPSARPKTVETKVEQKDIFFFLDIFLRGSSLRIRFDAKSLDYKFLGPKMEMGSQTNFRVLLKELIAGAPTALRNEGVRFLTAEKPAVSEGYDSERDFSAECRWLMTLSSLTSSR